MEANDIYPTISIDCIATHDTPDNEHSRLDAWFEQLNEIESAKDAT